MSDRVYIFDTTLRDGEQSPGCSMTVPEKLRMARKLVELGVDIVEAGFPIASEGDFEAVDAVSREFPWAQVAALARCCTMDVERAAQSLAHAKRPRIHTFIATSPIHLKYKLKKSQEQVLEEAVAAVELARRHVDDVEFSAEDGARTAPEYLEQIRSEIQAQEVAGAGAGGGRGRRGTGSPPRGRRGVFGRRRRAHRPGIPRADPIGNTSSRSRRSRCWRRPWPPWNWLAATWTTWSFRPKTARAPPRNTSSRSDRKYKLKKSQEQVLEEAVAAVELARRHVDDVEFSAEDGARTAPEYLEQIRSEIQAQEVAGAGAGGGRGRRGTGSPPRGRRGVFGRRRRAHRPGIPRAD